MVVGRDSFSPSKLCIYGEIRFNVTKGLRQGVTRVVLRTKEGEQALNRWIQKTLNNF